MPRKRLEPDFLVHVGGSQVHVVALSNGVVQFEILPAGPCWKEHSPLLCAALERLCSTVEAGTRESVALRVSPQSDLFTCAGAHADANARAHGAPAHT
jgi:hypothetical protein